LSWGGNGKGCNRAPREKEKDDRRQANIPRRCKGFSIERHQPLVGDRKPMQEGKGGVVIPSEGKGRGKFPL